MQRDAHSRVAMTVAALLALAGCTPVEDEELLLDAESGALLPEAGTSADAGVRDAASDAATLDGATEDAALPRDASSDANRSDASTDASADASRGDAGDPLDSLRQVCVDTINEHRATLGLAPLLRATQAQERCSDQGAKKDGDSKMAHSSAGSCSGLGAQNTCPSWGFGPGTGNATLEAALKRCLQQMWDEGAPPVPVKTCIADDSCFPKYGHWINMSSTTSRVVACGFYDMGKSTYWMNQDFGR